MLHKETKKAVILARGLGTRMRAAGSDAELDDAQLAVAEKGLKALMPVADGKNLLDFIIARLADAGFGQICMVIGPEHDEFRDYCAERGYDISFAIQHEPRGTADAVLAAEDFCAGENFAVVNSDNLYPLDSLRRLRDCHGAALIGFEIAELIEKSNIPAERIAKFATIEADAQGNLAAVVEKPETVPPDALVSMNAWIFSPKIFDACRSIELSPRGEFEITAAVTFAMGKLGEKFAVVKSNEGVLDMSSRADVATVASMIGEN